MQEVQRRWLQRWYLAYSDERPWKESRRKTLAKNEQVTRGTDSEEHTTVDDHFAILCTGDILFEVRQEIGCVRHDVVEGQILEFRLLGGRVCSIERCALTEIAMFQDDCDAIGLLGPRVADAGVNTVHVHLLFSLVEKNGAARFEEISHKVVLLLKGAIVFSEVVDVLCKALEEAISFVRWNCRRLVRHISFHQGKGGLEGDSLRHEGKEKRKEKLAKRHDGCRCLVGRNGLIDLVLACQA